MSVCLGEQKLHFFTLLLCLDFLEGSRDILASDQREMAFFIAGALVYFLLELQTPISQVCHNLTQNHAVEHMFIGPSV